MRRVALVALTVASLTLSGCSRQFAFRQDRRIHIVSPRNNATVDEPVVVAWEASDTGSDVFAVFVDRSPIAPGTGLRAIGRSDKQCRRVPTCPDAAYLALHGVYVTTSPTVMLPRLPDKRRNAGDKDQHEVTIVLIDQDAQRVGEAAFTVTFVIDHPRKPTP